LPMAFSANVDCSTLLLPDVNVSHNSLYVESYQFTRRRRLIRNEG
jgi:hypothetical protein